MPVADAPVPRRAFSAPDTDAPSEGAAGRPSRAIASTSKGDDVEQAGWGDDPELEVVTPVPPPAPVLPEPEAEGDVAGRRFASDSEGSPVDYVPRRSATSVTSPPEPAPSGSPQGSEPRVPTLPPPPPVRSSVLSDDPTDDDPDPAPQAPPGWRAWITGRGRVVALLAGLLLIALVVAIVASTATIGSAPTAGPSALASSASPTGLPPGTPDPAHLLTVEDLSGLDGGTWTLTSTSAPTASSPRPICLAPAPTDADGPTNAQLRIFGGTTGSARLLQVQESYPTAQTAEAAYTARLVQLGGCTATEALLTGGFAVTGLADQAVGIGVDDQESTTAHHAVLMVRTGRFIDLVDASQQGNHQFAFSQVAKTVAAAIQRQCSTAEGTCPTDVAVGATVPPVSGIAGWLTSNDLPRISPGAGRWGATDPATPNLVGSQCEGIDLNTIPGTSGAAHRTYLLADDSKAPSGFGVDEAVYTFAKPSNAASLFSTLTANITGCPKRTQTATIKSPAPVKATGTNGRKVSASTFTVTQKISDTKTVGFRVALALVGNRVVYLLANPGTGFDFTDAEWAALAARAAQRATQF